MCSAKEVQSGNFQEHQPREARFALGCQNRPWFHSAATHWLSLVLITTVLIKAVDGFCEHFGQKSSSFWSLSSGKLEAALTSELKRKQQETSIQRRLLCLLAFPSHHRDLVGTSTEDNRPQGSSMGFRRRERRKRKKPGSLYPQPYYNS